MFALALPHFSIDCNCSSVHESRSTDLTLLMCVPIPRWIPEHLCSHACQSRTSRITHACQTYLMQMKIPKFQLAHRGSALCLACGLHVLLGTMCHTFVPLAIRAALVRLQLDQLLQRIAVPLRRALRHRSPRHRARVFVRTTVFRSCGARTAGVESCRCS